MGAGTNGGPSLHFFPSPDRDEAPGTEQVGKGPNPAPFMRSMLAGEESEVFLLRNFQRHTRAGLCAC